MNKAIATKMADMTEPSAIPPPAANGALPAEDAAGQTVAAIAEADKISAGKRGSVTSQSILTRL